MAPYDPFSHELWRMAKAQYPVGSRLTGTVVQQAPFGVFLTLNLGHVHAVLRIGCFADAPALEPERSLPVTPLMLRYPDLGEVVTPTVIGYREGNHQLDVCTKPMLALH
jgi:hypothetical protein